MHHISTTPFGQRPVTAGLMASLTLSEQPAPVPQVDKWEVFRQLCVARTVFGVSDRDLTVLNALLSYHQGATLGDNQMLTVFPSNRSLAVRSHGMAESTLRRHLAALVKAGLILRHDSPNGKRYAAKDRSGEVVRAFGFSLRPLLTRASEIASSAVEVEAAQAELRALRSDVTLLRRDVLKLALYGQEEGIAGDWDAVLSALLIVHGQLRRNLDIETLENLRAQLHQMLGDVIEWLSSDTKEMSGKDALSERHHQNSKTDLSDLEPCLEKAGMRGRGPDPETRQRPENPTAENTLPNLPLGLVLKACPEIGPYADGQVRSWGDLINAASFVRGMMGISPSGYEEACQNMGEATAAVTIACILERVEEIRSPGGYLRSLARKAATDGFSPGPMVMALLNGSCGGAKS